MNDARNRTRTPVRPSTYTPTYSAVRRKPGDKGPRKQNQAKYALFAVGTIAALAFSMMWNPPTKTVHSFTKASDYVSEKESGCTNSGEGCHGSESSYADFNTYHPNAECTTCHDYEGVGCIPCHSPREHECALCHDGSMKAAPDRVRITDSFPSGHYRETSHTVTATDMSKRTRVTESGKASAACEDCHSRDLRTAHTAVPAVSGSSYGSDIGCGECHNDMRSFGQAEVLSDWQKRSCESCHRVGSSSPMHAAANLEPVKLKSDFGCASSGIGCHEATDLHELHADKPKSCSGSARKGEPGCHKLGAQAASPAATSCGGDDEKACHQSADRSGYRHKNVKAHSPGTSTVANAEYEGAACGGCHHMEPNGVSLLTEHAGVTCEKCHNDPGSAETIANGWEDRDTALACSGCHDGSGIGAAHTQDLTAQHMALDSEGCANTSAGCHPGSYLAFGDQGMAPIHSDCLDCHDKSSRTASEPNDRSCGEGRACHDAPGAFDAETGIHTVAASRIDGADRYAHQAGREQAGTVWRDNASGTETPCSACHSMLLGTEHGRPNSSAGTATCTGCHASNDAVLAVVISDWTAKDSDAACLACHDGEGAGVSHAQINSKHIAVEFNTTDQSQPGYCSQAKCHGSADVRILHAGTGCAVQECHGNDNDIVSSGVMSCGGTQAQNSCHVGEARHTKAPAVHGAVEIGPDGTAAPGTCQKEGCHGTTELRLLHAKTGCRTSGCHGENESGIKSCGGKDGQPGVCHSPSQRHTQIDARHTAVEIDSKGNANSTGYCAKAGCHGTADVRLLHPATSCKTAGCHVAGGPTNMSCGGTQGQPGACHSGTDRHKEIDKVHSLTELAVDGSVSPGACTSAGCHKSADARTLHAKKSCGTDGCHTEGGPEKRSCGGTDSSTGCHAGIGPADHRQSHSTSPLGGFSASSVSEGCVGECHDEDLIKEHRIRLIGGALEGDGDSVCAICHEEMSGAGRYADLPAVVRAIASGDRRCTACHTDGRSRSSASLYVRKACLPKPSMEPSHAEATTVEPQTINRHADDTADGRADGPRADNGADETTSSAEGAPTEGKDDAGSPAEAKDVVPGGCTQGSDEDTAAATRISGADGGTVCLKCHAVRSDSESVSQ